MKKLNFRELFLIIMYNFPNVYFNTRQISNITGLVLQDTHKRLRYLRRIGIINKRKDPNSRHGKRFLWYVTNWGWKYIYYLEQLNLV